MARLKGFQELTPVDDALQTFLFRLQIKHSKIVSIPLHSALNRILAEDIIAETDLPRFDRSAVDGYAIKAEETVGASQFRPKVFQLTCNGVVNKGRASEIWTGNPIPRGANAVVMLENTKRIRNRLEVWSPVTPSENLSEKGEDIRKGDMATEAGIRLKPQHLGLMAALGINHVKVYEKPRIAILATGNELAEPGSKLRGNQIYDTNKLVLSTMVSELGAEPIDLGIAKDDTEQILERLKSGVEESDAVVTSGGTSVGGPDLVPEAVNRLGKPGVIVHGVAMRPGMPTALAIVNRKPVLILPGNPVAAMIGFEVFAQPLICRLLGMKRTETRFALEAKMARKIAACLGRKTFVRVHVCQRNNEYTAEPISARGSGMISTMTKANGYVVVAENREGLEKGEVVSVQMFDTVEVVDSDV